MVIAQLLRIVGPSMEPAVRNGQVWLCTAGRVRPGRIIAFNEPDRPGLVAIKRVLEWRDGGWWVEGDHRELSRDSRAFGSVPPDQVIGILRCRVR